MFLVVQEWRLEDIMQDHGIVFKDIEKFSNSYQNDALRVLLLESHISLFVVIFFTRLIRFLL